MELRSIDDAIPWVGRAMYPDGKLSRGEFRYDSFFGKKDQVLEGQQGFLVTLPDQTEAPAHFHDIDQYQLFFGEEGCRYGPDPIPDLLVHYADAFTPYGPFSSGRTPLSFFTLRRRATVTTKFMPRDRKDLVRGGLHRNLYATPEVRLPQQGQALTDVLFKNVVDATQAFLVSAGPDTAFCLPSSIGTGGQYCCVVAGDVFHAAKCYGKKSLGWMDPEGGETSLRSGQDGCAIVVMQFRAGSL